uniref:DUF3828 domain-containing protein n=1 Tax=Roseihalotalea indica TaxID=2867963 RepID=A0AA49JGG2_9BACT|nr:hypothetical protein K4G66_00615 [Tunicatimonas sp. TK19036]
MNLRLLTIIFGLVSIGFQTSITDSREDIANRVIASPSPEIALVFINDYIKFIDDGSSELTLVEWVKSQKTVTDNFKSELERIITEAKIQDPELGLGFDPILDAQDYPEKGFELHQQDTDSEFLIVQGIEWETFQLTMKIKESDGKWLVDGSGIINIPEEARIRR